MPSKSEYRFIASSRFFTTTQTCTFLHCISSAMTVRSSFIHTGSDGNRFGAKFHSRGKQAVVFSVNVFHREGHVSGVGMARPWRIRRKNGMKKLHQLQHVSRRTNRKVGHGDLCHTQVGVGI